MNYLEKQIQEGRAAYERGLRTADKAEKANPYKPKGGAEERLKWLSWNHGWNQLKGEL